MGNPRIKKNYKYRFCQINVANKCLQVFTAMPIKKRVIACPQCKSFLKRKGIYAYKFWELRRQGFSDEDIFKQIKR